MTELAQPPGGRLRSSPPSSRWAGLRLTRAERRGLRTGLLFISPWLVGFLAFTLYPALASLYYSFTNFKILQEPTWIGLDNYASLIKDPLFWKSLGNTLYLTVVGVPLAVIVALGIALLLNRKGVRGIGVFRTIFYLPVVIPGVAAALLFLFLLNPANGLAQPDPRARRHRRARLVLRPGLGEERDHPADGLGRRRRRDHLPRARSRACRARSTRPPRSTAPAPGSSSATSRSR